MKKFFIIFAVLLLGGCTAATLALFGVVKIPGLKPMFGNSAKKPAAVAIQKPLPPVTAAATPKAQPTKPDVKPKVVTKSTDPSPAIDPDKGAKALAKVWNEVETPALVNILAKWKDDDAARVLSKMDADKVAEILKTLKPDRASKLSEIMQKLASVVPPQPA